MLQGFLVKTASRNVVERGGKQHLLRLIVLGARLSKQTARVLPIWHIGWVVVVSLKVGPKYRGWRSKQ